MKCLFCPAEIDDKREIHPEDQYSQKTHSAALSLWSPVTVTTFARGGQLVLLEGHVCPDENLQPGDVALTKGNRL